jgi:hypothetical protein
VHKWRSIFCLTLKYLHPRLDITGGTGWQQHTLIHIQDMYLQLGHRDDTSTVGASWGSMCTAVGDSPLDESEVLGLDRHQQFGLQDLLAATIEKIFYNLALCSVVDPDPIGSDFLAGSEKIKLL